MDKNESTITDGRSIEDEPSQSLDNQDNATWEGRPRVKKYAASKFRPNDKVYTSGRRGLQGPFIVSSVPGPQTYLLCAEDGTKVEGGRVFAESELQWA